MKLTREQVEALLAGATPGQWKADDVARVVAPYMCINGLSALFEIAWVTIPHDSERGYTDDAFNPDVAAANLALIAAAPDLARELLAAWDREAKLREAVAETLSAMEAHQLAYPALTKGYTIDAIRIARAALGDTP